MARLVSVTLACLFASALASGAPAPQQSDRADQGFTTGPPATAPGLDRDRDDRIDRSSHRTDPQSDPDSADIRVNQVTSGAQNETSFSINPLDEDNWVGVANDYRNGGVESGWYTTLDGGDTFKTGTFGVKSGYSFSGDPCVSFAPNGYVHVVCMMYNGPGGSAVYSFRSKDSGLTWSNGKEIDLADSNDKPQVDVDRSQGSHRGDITTAWDRFSGADIYVSTSSDNGKKWSGSQRINDSSSRNTISPDVAYGADSELYVMWADRGSDEIWVDKSTDGGVSWGSDVKVASFTSVPSPIPGSDFRMFDIFAMAADWTEGPYSGNVYVAYHNWLSGAQHADIRCATSSDGGSTWSNRKVNKGDGGGQVDQVFPGIVVDPHGNANICFYDRRLDANNFLLWTWVARSSDGGSSWTNRRASDVGWDHTRTEFSGTFIGDYIDVDASAHRVMPFWCDGRNQRQDVYTDSMAMDLYTNKSELSASSGGTVNFTINIGPNHAGHGYVLLGSASGTDPGSDIGGVHLPLNYDFFTRLTIVLGNTSVFQNFRGTLDGEGSATATLDTQGPFDPALDGIDLDFAVLISDSGWVYASNPTRVSLTK